MPNGSRPVYSTGSGRICPECGMPVVDCVCREKKGVGSGGNVAEVRREVKGRKGKPVTAIRGLALDRVSLSALASELKRSCGAGGSIKGGVILIQGNRIDEVKSFLENKGFKVKQTGG